jgi:hypothetical protein
MQDDIDLKELECSICIEVKDGEIHQYTHATGDKYVGAWKDGLKHGQGTYTYADGRKYVGEYKDDVPHGFGTGFSADGAAEYQGEWANGEPYK